MLYATVRQRKIHVKNPVTVIQNGIGVDQVVLDMDDEWKAMTSIVCVFRNGDTAKERLYSYGQLLEVPWECLTQTGLLSLSCTGYVGSEKVMTTMMPDSYWNVVQNGPATGDVPLEPTPTLYEQVLAAATAAEEAAIRAEQIRAQLLEDRENGAFDAETVEITGITETEASGGENTVTFSDGRTLTVRNGKVGAVGPKGPKGDTGATGPQGPKGDAGETGRGLSAVTYEPSVNRFTVTYTDGEITNTDGPILPDAGEYILKSGDTFTGAVYAWSGTSADAQLRNTALVSDETYPTANGQINWQYA